VGPFSVNPDNANAALELAWADENDEISVDGGKWTAHHKNAPDGELIRGSTPDELNRNIRADWMARQPGAVPPQRGPEGLGPS
jgi:hypothetical protein